MVGDPDRLQQIIWNLISNAIKFTPSHGRVVVTLAHRDNQFEINVRDNGKGMTPDFLGQAFDRFRQADSSATRSQGGLGIGLAIARHLAELHGGSIQAESDGPDRGSRFWVLLPAVTLSLEEHERRPAEPVEAQGGVGELSPDLSGVRILIVEDQRDARDLIVEVLRAAGGEVAEARSVAEALQVLPIFRPDVLISDIAMPDEDGYSLVRRIRQRPAHDGGHTPAIAVSAYAREEDRLRSVSAGFQLHLPKPFDPAELKRAIRRLVAAGDPGGRSPAAGFRAQGA
jgi:CheY-like chemotaxis protein